MLGSKVNADGLLLTEKKVRAMIHSTIIRGQVALLEGELQQKPEARQLQFELK